jgi:hypothetical protein
MGDRHFARVRVTPTIHKALLDLNTGKILKHVYAANDILGTYAYHVSDNENKILLNYNKTDIRRAAKRGNVKLINTDQPVWWEID